MWCLFVFAQYGTSKCIALVQAKSLDPQELDLALLGCGSSLQIYLECFGGFGNTIRRTRNMPERPPCRLSLPASATDFTCFPEQMLHHLHRLRLQVQNTGAWRSTGYHPLACGWLAASGTGREYQYIVARVKLYIYPVIPKFWSRFYIYSRGERAYTVEKRTPVQWQM